MQTTKYWNFLGRFHNMLLSGGDTVDTGAK
jgi:hypothetical protein